MVRIGGYLEALEGTYSSSEYLMSSAIIICCASWKVFPVKSISPSSSSASPVVALAATEDLRSEGGSEAFGAEVGRGLALASLLLGSSLTWLVSCVAPLVRVSFGCGMGVGKEV